MTEVAVRYALIHRLGFRLLFSRGLGGRPNLGDIGWPSPAGDLIRRRLERVFSLWTLLYRRPALPGNAAGTSRIQSAASLKRYHLVALQSAGWCDLHLNVAFVAYESRSDTCSKRGF